MSPNRLVLSRAALTAFVLLACLPAQDPALRGLDPVALCGGTETPGTAEWTAEHAGFTYHFASDANRARFVAEPERYGIQFGGACARMGPLSGIGSPQRFHVHGERIYLFASDGCREGFRKHPERFLDPAEPRPEVDAAAAAAAAALLQRTVVAHGGRDRLLALRGYEQQRSAPEGDTTKVERLRVQWPGRVRRDSDYHKGDEAWRYANVVTAEAAFFDENGKVRAMPAAARDEVLRELGREPILLLRALLDGDAVAVAAGRREVLGVEVDELAVWWHGRTTHLGIGADGRVATSRCRGRGPGLWFGAVELRYGEFVELSGVVVPTQRQGQFDGKESAGLRAAHVVAIDPEFAADVFAPRR